MSSVATDSAQELQQYAHPEMLVTADWVAEHLDDPDVVIIESDEDVLLYDTGHIPSAIKVDWHLDLNDQLTRDYVDGQGFASLCSKNGISRDSTVVFYGDAFNWWAAYALWVFKLFGHPDVRLLNGGRAKWIKDGRELSTDVPKREATDYPVVERDDAPIRAYRDDTLGHIGKGPLIDVRSPGEYSGELLHMPEYPQEGALRGGHIPTAKSQPWKATANEDDGTFKDAEFLRGLYEGKHGLSQDDNVIVYCRIGERSSHTWFVLTHLLGYTNVRNYDGSWTEWGNLVRAPIER